MREKKGPQPTSYGRYIPTWKLSGWSLAVCALALGGLRAAATPPPPGIVPVVYPAGGFAIDGNLLANTPAAGVGDWVYSTNAPGTGGGVMGTNGIPFNPTTTFHIVDPYNGNDNVFPGGSKWTDNPNTWQWTTNKASNKTDINNALVHISNDTNGHIWAIVAADRLSTSGDSYMDFEFLQNTLSRSNNGYFVSAGPDGGRTVNDLLLSLAFTGGGNTVDFFVWRWMSDGSGGFMYVDSTASEPSNRVFAALNSNNVAVPYGAFGSTNYSPDQFGEAAIDMTALFGNFDQCTSIGFKTIMIKTKTSQSATATISDFVEPIQYSLRIGPSAIAGTNQTRCSQGAVTDFSLNGYATAGLQPIVSTNWTAVNGIATIDDASALVTTAHVFTATATLRLTVIESNGCTETNDVLLTVAPLPVCSIAGPSNACPANPVQFLGPAGMSAYSWTISGNGSISGPTNAQSVTVSAGAACGQSFTLSLTVRSNLCSTACATTVLVQNTVPPSLIPPPDRLLECPAATGTNATGVATAQGICGHVSLSYSDSVSNTCGGAYVVSRTWTATDLCGNSSNAVQTITLQDTTRPIITCPTNRILECPADTSTNNCGVATATDTCSQVLVGSSDIITTNCGNTFTIARTWTAMDACGNSATCLQTITVRDTTKPTITCPTNVVLECPADTGPANSGAATATDTCNQVTISYTDSTTNTCGGGMIIKRTWTATDACSNSATCVQTITLRDTTKPVITCPPDRTLDCPADTSTNNTGVATATDTCSQVTITHSDAITSGCGGSYVITRTWTATDACSNSAGCVQRITVQDKTVPVLVSPPDVVLQCPANTTTNHTGVATATDTCSAVAISYSDSISVICTGYQIIARTWFATDACSNIASHTQYITVQDTNPPVLICPPDVTLECPAITDPGHTGAATATDSCSYVAATIYTDAISNTCGGSYVIARTWTTWDGCHNSNSCVQHIIVRDTSKPVITCPPDRTLECPTDTSTNNTGTATATDTCSQVTITHSDTITNGCGGTYGIARTWTATDACGNSASCVQHITVQDTTRPLISCPPDRILQCPANTSTNSTGVPTVSDTCSQISLVFSDVTTNGCGGTYGIARTWTATDACGNSAGCVQHITVQDTNRPVLICPPDRVLECPADTTTNNTGVATATDTCSQFTITHTDVLTNGCGNTYSIARTWVATDACGNTATCVQHITVQDTTRPVITCPPNRVLECPANTSTNNTGVATATDTCNQLIISYADTTNIPCAGSRVISRTWTATDTCGNSASCVQTITVQDTTRPTLSLPANLVLQCPANTATNATGVATASDACSAVTIGCSDSVSNICGGAKVIRRTWTATDACGNSTNGIQTLTIQDTNYPAITCPSNVVLECGASTAPSATGTATGSALCASLTINYSDSVSNICGGSKVITRTWTAADSCGRQASCVQTITVLDTRPPTITCAPLAAVTYSQGGWSGGGAGPLLANYFTSVFPQGLMLGIYAPSNGNAAPNGLWWQPNSAGLSALQAAISQGSGGGGPITQDAANSTGTYGAGGCGRQTLALTCNIAFNEAGYLGSGANNFGSLIYTNANDSLSGLTVRQILDAINRALAGLALPAGYDFSSLAGIANNINLSFDGSGPTSWALAHLSPPVRVVQCPSLVPAPDPALVSASDTCSGLVSISVLPDNISLQTCPNRYTITRTWVARDACGNSNSCSYQLMVNDTTPPTISCPSNKVVECGSDISPNATGTATAQDNCGSVAVSYSDVLSNSCGGAGVIYRTWLALDPCGNSNSCVQTITLRDTTPPSLICGPARTVSSTNIWTFDDPVASDTCSAVNVQVLNTVTNGSGPNTLSVTRTWLALDGCGNSNNCQQTITVLMGQPPSVAPLPSWELAPYGSDVTLSATASGSAPLAYQWRFDGTNLPGATGSSLVLHSLQFSNAGLYNVVVSNPAGATSSSVCVLDVGAKIFAQAIPGGLRLTWPGQFILQAAPAVQGPFADVPVASSPYTVITATNRQQFFRLRSLTPNFAGSYLTNGAYLLSGPGIPGCNFIFQSSTDMVNWINLQTNASPISFVDSNASPGLFYRAVMAQPILNPTPVSITIAPRGQTAALGSDVAFSVAASGTPPLAYQWRLNGSRIAGASASSLTLHSLQFSNAGLYSVVVSNSAGAVASADAVLNVAAQLLFLNSPNSLQLAWPNAYFLQSATNVAGPYNDLPGATSPLTITTLSGPRRFFRLRSQAFGFVGSLGGGQYTLSGPGVPGYNFVFLASTNSVNWIALQTNTAPVNFLDPNASQYPGRVYRAIPLVP